MTNATKTISFKCPKSLVERLPCAGNGRSKAIIKALASYYEPAKPAEWKPTGARGRKLAAILKRGDKERGPEMSEAAIEAEIQERKGRNF